MPNLSAHLCHSRIASPADTQGRARIVRRASALVALALLAACGKSGDSPTGTTSGTPAGTPTGTGAVVAYNGVFDTGLKGGVITLVNTAAATGTIQAAGEAAVALTGTFNATTGAFTMSGGAYSVVAAVDAPIVVGIVTVRGNLGSGTMAALPVSATQSIAYWCGTTTGTSPGGINFAVQGGTVVGVVQGVSSGLPTTGTASASDITVRWVPGAGQTGSATGKISGATMTGTWMNSFGGAGTWTATATGCR